MYRCKTTEIWGKKLHIITKKNVPTTHIIIMYTYIDIKQGFSNKSVGHVPN